MAATRGTREDRKIAVALTFDFDADSGSLRDGVAASSPNDSRWLYGVNEGMPRILRLLEKYQVPGSFYVPGAVCAHHADAVRAIPAAGHELGHHGYYHEPPSGLSESEERAILERGLDALATISPSKPKGYRAPSWELSDQTFSLLAEYGFLYDGSQLASDRPHW